MFRKKAFNRWICLSVSKSSVLILLGTSQNRHTHSAIYAVNAAFAYSFRDIAFINLSGCSYSLCIISSLFSNLTFTPLIKRVIILEEANLFSFYVNRTCSPKHYRVRFFHVRNHVFQIDQPYPATAITIPTIMIISTYCTLLRLNQSTHRTSDRDKWSGCHKHFSCFLHVCSSLLKIFKT